MKIIDIIGDNYCGSFTRIHKGCRAVIIKDGKMLLSYETANDQWMLPGGTLEENETEEECVIRELCEETGYIIKPMGCALEIDEYYEDCKWVNLYYSGEITGTAETRLTEAEKKAGMEPRWLPVSEILAIFSEHEKYAGTDEMRRGMYQREYMALTEMTGKTVNIQH